MYKKYDTDMIMKKVRKSRPHILRQALQKMQDENEAHKTLEKAHKSEIRSTRKEAQLAKQKLQEIEDKKRAAIEKAKKTRKKNQRASSNQKKS